MSTHINVHETAAGAGNSRAMEPETIQNNGRSSKSQMSRGNLMYLMVAVLMLMTAFISCSKDRSGSGGDGGNELVIDATVVDGKDYNGYIANVKAEMEYRGDHGYYWYVLASGKYQNGRFKLMLPDTVANQYLRNITDGLDDFEGTISDKNAKIGRTEIFAHDDGDEYIGEFYCEEYYDSDNWIAYVYVDRNVTMKGYENNYSGDEYYYYDEWDCAFTKGWNMMYIVWSYNENSENCLHTTKKPSGVNYKWYYYDRYDDWKKSPIGSGKSHNLFSKMKKSAVK